MAPLSDGPSEDDETVASRASSAAERRKDRARVEREVAAQRLPADGKRGAVGSRVTDHEECVRHDRVIARLEHHPTLGGLDVGEPRLHLECVDASVTVEDGIPRAEVGSPVNGHLGT